MAVHYIYKIRHTASGKIYIGRTNDVVRRWKEHARGTGTKSSYISCAIQKHGVDAFEFDIIAETDDERVEELEQRYIRLHDCVVPRGYNLIDRAEGNCGHHRETREKMSASRTWARRSTAETTGQAREPDVHGSAQSSLRTTRCRRRRGPRSARTGDPTCAP